MSGLVAAVRDRVSHAGSAAMAGWVGFWFRPQSAYPLGVVRIFFGVITFFFVGADPSS
ncbi:hypothetical protein [Fodinicola feengrottensis]|uniref:hypothetical protein n=1 Tax=Fodinicola feengrottensis TaxID=435914 RepID=UPI0013D3D421|nr:hypothetical protein [Fodinicola feengrottensis]